jgi:antitoxin PrlF
MPTATLTTKGQITIPHAVREHLGLKSGDQLDFVFESTGGVTLRTKRVPFEKLRGVLKSSGQKPAGVRQMDEGIERAVRARWAVRRRSK